MSEIRTGSVRSGSLFRTPNECIWNALHFVNRTVGFKRKQSKLKHYIERNETRERQADRQTDRDRQREREREMLFCYSRF